MRKVLVTGSLGFLGSNLVRKLRQNSKIQVFELKSDLLDFATLEAEIRSIGVLDTCYHFAGLSYVPDCENNIGRAYSINSAAALSLAELLVAVSPGLHFIFPSTAQLYRELDGQPIDEETPIRPRNVYSRTKLLAEQGLKTLSDEQNLKVTVLRLFNHSHKSQDSRFLLPSVYHQILKARESKEKKIKVGELNLIRDIGAITDLLEAFYSVFDKGPKGQFNVYNICTGAGKKLEDIVSELIARSGAKITIEKDLSLLRPWDAHVICGNPKKFIDHYNWQPMHASNVFDLVDSFLSEVR